MNIAGEPGHDFALLLLGLAASCAPPACHPLTIAVAQKEERARLERAPHGIRTTETGRLEEDRRTEIFRLFEWLRDLGVTSLLVSEEPPPGSVSNVLEEEFLADGILRLRMAPVTETSFQRRIQCTKMRSVNQDSDDHTLLFENERFEAARAIG